MPIAAKWIDPEETIVLIDYQGTWTWNEAEIVNGQAAEMIASKPYRCDIIGNFRTGTMESVGPAIANARRIVARYSENVTLIVVITNPLISMLASAFKTFDTRFSRNLRTVSTMEQAQSIIAQDRAAQT